VPKITINNTINLLLITAISILVISNHNSFRVLFDKIDSVILFVNNVSTGTSTVPILSAHFPFL